jgi:hypothetical protein
MEAYCIQAYAEALEVIPSTLAENAGLNPITIVTELRNRHAQGEQNAGINIRKVSGGIHMLRGIVTYWIVCRGLYPISWKKRSCNRYSYQRVLLNSRQRLFACYLRSMIMCKHGEVAIYRIQHWFNYHNHDL